MWVECHNSFFKHVASFGQISQMISSDHEVHEYKDYVSVITFYEHHKFLIAILIK